MGKKDVVKIIESLIKFYPDAKGSLDHNSSFELLVAVILSAQCTDNRVNLTTPELFKKYNTPEKMVKIDINELEKIIHPCGFYKNKAKNIKETSKILIEKYNGNVPNSMNDLVDLPGVGRKTANVIMLEAFNNPQGIAVDTHCKRLSNRLGLSDKSDPTKIELDLLKIVPKKYYKNVNHIFMYHGRNICTAQNPKCDICPIKQYCDYRNK